MVHCRGVSLDERDACAALPASLAARSPLRPSPSEAPHEPLDLQPRTKAITAAAPISRGGLKRRGGQGRRKRRDEEEQEALNLPLRFPRRFQRGRGRAFPS